ncbi:MAG: hypothetical protein Q9169_008098 [Polycauliona sp. 2 TL-2023]
MASSKTPNQLFHDHVNCLTTLMMVRKCYFESDFKLPAPILQIFHDECQTLISLSKDQKIEDVFKADDELKNLEDLVERIVEYGLPDTEDPLADLCGLQELVRKKEAMVKAYREEHGIPKKVQEHEIHEKVPWIPYPPHHKVVKAPKGH